MVEVKFIKVVQITLNDKKKQVFTKTLLNINKVKDIGFFTEGEAEVYFDSGDEDDWMLIQMKDPIQFIKKLTDLGLIL